MATPTSSPDMSPRADSDIPHTEHRLRSGRLGVIAIAFIVVSAAAPLTAMAGGAPVAMLVGNGRGIPFAYLIVSAMLLLFAVGYTAMARHHTSTGAFYAYVARGLGQHAGGAAAWIALLGYNAMQIGLYGLFGSATASFCADNLGFDPPWWACAFVAWAVIALLGYRQVDLSVKVLGVLVAAEFLIVLLLDGAIIGKGGEGGHSGVASHLAWDSFSFDALTSGSLAIALLFNSASYIGFESTTIYSEEAKDPRRTVPRATYLAVAVIGVFYSITTFLMVSAQGGSTLVEHLGGLKPDPTVFLFELGDTYLGSSATKVMSLLFATSVFAALLAFHNAVARYLFALGREGLVPARLGHTHTVHLSPHMGSISQTVLAAVVLTIFVVTDKDPVLALFTWLTQLGTLAILFLMAFASLAVVVFFAKYRGARGKAAADDAVTGDVATAGTGLGGLWRTLVAPALSAVFMGGVAAYAASQFGNLIGDPNSALAWQLPALIGVAVVIGVISSFVLKARAPQQWALMGMDRVEATDGATEIDGTSAAPTP